MDSFTQDSQLRKYIAECDSLISVEEVKKLRTSKPFVEGGEGWQAQPAGVHSCKRLSPLQTDFGHWDEARSLNQRPPDRL